MVSASASPGVIVVVEDEEDTRELLRELIESRGYRVETAQDGIEALEVLGRVERVSLVLVDLLMPRMDGLELLQALGADPVLSRLNVVVSTSAPDRVPAGIPSLPKPVDIERLFALVAATCGPPLISRGARP
jgi:two-component system response regulator CpxR